MAKYNKETIIIDEFIKSPIKDNTLIFFSHFGRYFYASKALDIKSTDTIIDASCGEGYGTYSLSKLVKTTYGLDINEEYIKSARKIYYDEIGQYETNKIDLTFLTYNDFYRFNQFLLVDKIFSIESFEHIPKEEIEGFIDKLMSKLKVGGSMFVTVPLGNNEASSFNPFHCNEPSIDFIYNIFSKYFKKIDIEIDSFVNSFNKECQYAYLILKNKK
jgi:cyclopropane fatty-acyl-phospholipid synthase-like methyltransferase